MEERERDDQQYRYKVILHKCKHHGTYIYALWDIWLEEHCGMFRQGMTSQEARCKAWIFPIIWAPYIMCMEEKVRNDQRHRHRLIVCAFRWSSWDVYWKYTVGGLSGGNV